MSLHRSKCFPFLRQLSGHILIKGQFTVLPVDPTSLFSHLFIIFLICNDNVFLLCFIIVVIIPVQVHGPASQHVSNSTMTVSTPNFSVLSRGSVVEDRRDEYRKEALRKARCLSIGIQVFSGRMNGLQ